MYKHVYVNGAPQFSIPQAVYGLSLDLTLLLCTVQKYAAVVMISESFPGNSLREVYSWKDE